MQQNIIVRLAAQGVGAFKTQMAQASASVKGLHQDALKAADGNAAAVRKAGMAMSAIGIAAVAAAAASAKAAIDLETRMQNVATIWTDSSVTIAQAGDRVVDMSTRLPQSANNLAEGLYDIASSGFQGAAGLTVLEAAGTAASAGLTTTAVAARGITAVLNAYGLAASSATTVSDVLFQTVNLGVVTFEELSNQLGDFVGSASVAGINIRDASAAFATMTLNGISAAEAGTSMNRVIQTLIQPSAELASALKAMGYESGLAALEQLGLNGVMAGLAKQTGGGAEAMSSLFPEIRALRGALALTSAEGQNYNRVQGAMNDEAQLLGATQRALAEQQKSTSYQFQILKNSVVAAAIDFGQSLLPAIKMVVGAFQAAIDVWNAIPGPLKVIVGVAGLLAGIFVGIAGALLLLAPGILMASAAFGTLTAAIGTATTASLTFLATPWGIALAAVGGAVAIATGLWAKHAKGQADTKRRVDELKDSLDAETGALTEQTQQLLRDRIVKDDLDKKAKELGVSLQDLMLAMSGDEAAAARVEAQAGKTTDELIAQAEAADKAAGGHNALEDSLSTEWTTAGSAQQAHSDLTKAIGKGSSDVDKATSAFEREKTITTATEGAMGQLTRATTQKAEADKAAAEAADAHRQQMEGLATTMSKAYAVSAAMTNFADANEATQTTISDTLKRESEARYDAQREANDRMYDLEKEGLDRSQQARRDGIDQEHEDRGRANELLFRQQNDALEADQRLRKNALDDEHRDRKQALDRVFRDERHAMDRRLDLLDEEWDKRRKAADRQYEAEKNEAEFMVRTTWGTEREGWIARLAVIEEGHDHTLAEIDRGQQDETDAIKDGQSDSEQARQNGLDDQLQAEQEGLAAILDAEKQHLKDTQDAVTAAEGIRYDGLVRHHEEMVKAENKGLDDRIAATEKKLDDLQKLENDKADVRRSSAKSKREQTLADAIAALEQNNKDQEAKLENLRVIWERAGRNLSTEMLEELQGLEPGMIAQLAKAGPSGFNAFMDALGTSVKGVDAGRLGTIFSPFNDEIKGIIARIGEFGGADLMANVAKGVANNPQGAQQLRDILAQLMAPKEVSPGVWAVPKPGGGFYPMKMTAMAAGGISRDPAVSSTPVLWAEAGPEAYIPLGASKRSQSTRLLDEVAGIFGYGLVRMANGGIFGTGTSGGTSGASYVTQNHVEVSVRVAAGVDPDAVGIAVRREVERSLDTLARQVTVKAWRN